MIVIDRNEYIGEHSTGCAIDLGRHCFETRGAVVSGLRSDVVHFYVSALGVEYECSVFGDEGLSRTRLAVVHSSCSKSGFVECIDLPLCLSPESKMDSAAGRSGSCGTGRVGGREGAEPEVSVLVGGA